MESCSLYEVFGVSFNVIYNEICRVYYKSVLCLYFDKNFDDEVGFIEFVVIF